MSLPRILPLALCYLVFCGCSAEAHEQDHDTHEGHDHDADHPHEKTPAGKPAGKPARKTGRLDVERFDHFGQGATEGKTLTPSDLAANAAAYKDKHVRVKGEVTAVCKKKGCWLIVSDGETKIRAFTKGHSFFVPKDCEGRTAVLEGTFSVTEESVALKKHLLEDEGRFEEAKNVTKPDKNVLRLDAEGVALAKVASRK